MTEAAEEMERAIGTPAEQWSELSMVEIGLRLVHGVDTFMPSPETIFYEVSNDAAQLLVREAAEHVDAFDAARKIATANIWNSKAMPASLRAFSVGVMNGTFRRPPEQGGGITKLFLRWQIYEGCKTARDLFGLEIYRQDHKSADSAADLMANLSTEFGHEYAYSTIRDWFLKPSYAKFRNRCEAATSYLNDKKLFELGIIKKLR